MRSPFRSVLALGLAVLVITAAAGVSPAPVAAADFTMSAAENEMIGQLNTERTKRGLLKLRVDPRLMSIARQRSADMARYHYFSHTQPDGRDAFDFIRAAGITWYGAGEVIAWNTASTLAESVVRARDGWMGSSGHRAIVLSNGYNYFGIGLAIDPSNGRRLWTGVFLDGPDRTGGYAKLNPVGRFSIPAAMRYTDVPVTWSGGDVQLVRRTAGYRHFQLRVRTDGGPWTTLSSATTSTSRTLRVWRGHYYDFEVRTCDRVANCGSWASVRLQG